MSKMAELQDSKVICTLIVAAVSPSNIVLLFCPLRFFIIPPTFYLDTNQSLDPFIHDGLLKFVIYNT